jgi:hypothetical protein
MYRQTDYIEQIHSNVAVIGLQLLRHCRCSGATQQLYGHCICIEQLCHCNCHCHCRAMQVEPKPRRANRSHQGGVWPESWGRAGATGGPPRATSGRPPRPAARPQRQPRPVRAHTPRRHHRPPRHPRVSRCPCSESRCCLELPASEACARPGAPVSRSRAEAEQEPTRRSGLRSGLERVAA